MKRDLLGPIDRVTRLLDLVLKAHGMSRDAMRVEVSGSRFFHRLRREGALRRCLEAELRHLRQAS